MNVPKVVRSSTQKTDRAYARHAKFNMQGVHVLRAGKIVDKFWNTHGVKIGVGALGRFRDILITTKNFGSSC